LRSESTTQGAKPPKEKLAGAQPKEIPVAPALEPTTKVVALAVQTKEITKAGAVENKADLAIDKRTKVGAVDLKAELAVDTRTKGASLLLLLLGP